MQQSLAELGWTGSIGTTCHRLIHGTVGQGVTDWTVGRHAEGKAVRRTSFEEHPDHLRNDIASTLDEDLIADTDVFAPDFILIVQRGTTDSDTTNVHWFEISRWRQCSSAPHANVDCQYPGDSLLRCKLKGN